MSQNPSDAVQLPPVELSSSEQLVTVAITVLEQAVNLIEGTLKNDLQLSFASKLIPGSTIGKQGSFTRMFARLTSANAPHPLQENISVTLVTISSSCLTG